MIVQGFLKKDLTVCDSDTGSPLTSVTQGTDDSDCGFTATDGPLMLWLGWAKMNFHRSSSYWDHLLHYKITKKLCHALNMHYFFFGSSACSSEANAILSASVILGKRRKQAVVGREAMVFTGSCVWGLAVHLRRSATWSPPAWIHILSFSACLLLFITLNWMFKSPGMASLCFRLQDFSLTPLDLSMFLLYMVMKL